MKLRPDEHNTDNPAGLNRLHVPDLPESGKVGWPVFSGRRRENNIEVRARRHWARKQKSHSRATKVLAKRLFLEVSAVAIDSADDDGKTLYAGEPAGYARWYVYEALEAGTVWWDGELFTGGPAWEKLMAAQAPKRS
jgi:hypothetical protein